MNCAETRTNEPGESRIDGVNAMKYELSDESRKLWHYSPKVLFSMFDEEQRLGSVTYPEEAF